MYSVNHPVSFVLLFNKTFYLCKIACHFYNYFAENEGSLDTEKDINMKENLAYELPPLRIKMKKNISYEAPPSEC